jgi:DNA repair protein RadD
MPDWVADKQKRLEKDTRGQGRAGGRSQGRSRGGAQGAGAEGGKKSGKTPTKTEPDGKAQRNFTDPESRILKTKDGYIQGYNAQAAVDDAHQIIVAQTLTLGLTATPCRGDGRGLGNVFQTIIQCPQVGELVEQGFLVPTRVYAPVDPDLHGVRILHGDYVESELADRMDRPKLVGDIVTNWLKYGERRKTACFATNVRHSLHIRDEFIATGVRAEHIDGSTPMDERDATLARVASGEIEVVSNCMVLTEGWDMPALGCLILARPTKQLGLYRQMIGRGLRPAQDKTNCIVIDHSGATYRLGFAEDFIEWTLDPDHKAENPTHTARDGDRPGGPKIVERRECGAARIGGMACLSCGYLPAPSPRAVEVIDGDLGLVDSSRRARPNPDDSRIRAEWHGMLSAIAVERGYKPGWVAHQYHKKFGEWPPPGTEPLPREPSIEVRRWVRSRMIAYARRRKSARQRSAPPRNVMSGSPTA